MGDRANILVKEDEKNSGVYLYSHWNGTNLPRTLQRALSKKWQWDDAQYLSRIIFDCMTEHCHGEEGGYGITSGVWDGEGRIVKVKVTEQEVSIGSKTWTFDEFIKIPEVDFESIWNN